MGTKSIEFKMIVSIICFTLFIVLFERFQLSENVIEQFKVSKSSKNKLLLDTIAPIVTLNISLGLEDANREYLGKIGVQNSDIRMIELFDAKEEMIFRFAKDVYVDKERRDALNYSTAVMIDTMTGEKAGQINIDFFDDDYRTMITDSKKTTFEVIGFTLIALAIFVFLIKREFVYLKRLSETVLSYDPKKNNFPLDSPHREDEVGIIHSAIISMVEKINSYAQQLDEVNASLESKVQERTTELEEANRKLEQISITDTLTRLPNRRHFETYYEQIWGLAQRNGSEISVVMCDIDFFKKVNDTYGHEAGDLVLQQVALRMRESFKRESDFVARYGGEEFVMVLFETSAEEAKRVCETIQAAMLQCEGHTYQGKLIKPVTLSFGICSMVPAARHSGSTLVRCADKALYMAKEGGRNRIVVQQPIQLDGVSIAV